MPLNFFSALATSLSDLSHSTRASLTSSKMINIAGIASVVLFYLLILAVGMWAARKNTGGADQEVTLERNLSLPFRPRMLWFHYQG